MNVLRGNNSVRKNIRLGMLSIVAMASAAVGAFGISSPAQAATNPYTPQSACSHEFGGTWSTTTDGHRTVVTTSNVKVGDVYLMYNSATGYNCVATIKTSYVGQSSFTYAELDVQGDSSLYGDGDNYSYYAATRAHAANKCVEYTGYIASPSNSVQAIGGRYTWGNCG
jgi:hypothetical protein